MTKKILFLIGILVFVFSSCDNDDDFCLKVDKSEIVLSSTNKQDKFVISSNGDWVIKAPSLEYGIGIIRATGKFYTLSQGMGNGNTIVIVKLKDSPNNKAMKETLTIEGKHKPITILLKKE